LQIKNAKFSTFLVMFETPEEDETTQPEHGRRMSLVQEVSQRHDN
jgi:hypothetical protein